MSIVFDRGGVPIFSFHGCDLSDVTLQAYSTPGILVQGTETVVTSELWASVLHLSSDLVMYFISCSLGAPLLRETFVPTQVIKTVAPGGSRDSRSIVTVRAMSINETVLPYPSVIVVLHFSFVYVLLCKLSGNATGTFLRVPRLIKRRFRILACLLNNCLHMSLDNLCINVPRRTTSNFGKCSIKWRCNDYYQVSYSVVYWVYLCATRVNCNFRLFITNHVA